MQCCCWSKRKVSEFCSILNREERERERASKKGQFFSFWSHSIYILVNDDRLRQIFPFPPFLASFPPKIERATAEADKLYGVIQQKPANLNADVENCLLGALLSEMLLLPRERERVRPSE